MWQRYQDMVNSNCFSFDENLSGLPYWQNKLFATILIYFVPLSLLALIPGIFMSIVGGLYPLAIFDLLGAACVVSIAFLPGIKILHRKALFVSVIYLMAIILLYFLGSFGPGLLYLNAVTIFVILIFAKRFAYWSVAINTLICLLFGIAIHFKMVNSLVIPQYSMGSWFAVCINLLILCAVSTVLLPMLFNGLQSTIEQQLVLENELISKQQTLERNEKRFRALVENSHDMLTLFDEKGLIEYISPAVEKTFGATNSDNKAHNAVDVIHPDDYETALHDFRQVLQNPGITVSSLVRNRTKNGTYIWVEGGITNMLNVPWVNAIVANFRDVTVRKHFEDKMIIANRLYSVISQINQTIVHASNEKELYEKVCDIAIEYGHFSMVWIGMYEHEDDTINLISEKGTMPEDIKLIEKVKLAIDSPAAKVRDTGKYKVFNDTRTAEIDSVWKAYLLDRSCLSSCILPIKKFDKVIGALYLCSKIPQVFNEEEMILLAEVMGDISFGLEGFEKARHRKELETNLLISEERLNRAQQIAHLGSWELDLNTSQIVWSDEMFRIFGLQPRSIIPKVEDYFSFIHPEDIERIMADFVQMQSDFTDVANHHRILLRNGSLRHLFSEAKFEFDQNGKAIRLYGITHDVTEQIRAEEMIRANELAVRLLNAELEERVLVRTRELVTANRELEAFSFTVSHDLRTPIRAIQIFGNLLHKKYKNVDDPAETYTDNILKCTEEMTDLINDLLAFSKLGRQELNRTEVDMNQLVSEVINNVMSVEEPIDVAITVNKLPSVEADYTLIKSVLFNLISNAVKYRKMEEPGALIINGNIEGDYAIYRVHDTGIGFDMKYYNKLFKPFSRLHTSSEYKGTGAGLAICDRIISKHGGKIWGESVEKVGSTFYFSLPVKNLALV